jgi:hypothetical protein
VAITADRNVTEKEGERKLKYTGNNWSHGSSNKRFKE